jgi:hypothetical protein
VSPRSKPAVALDLVAALGGCGADHDRAGKRAATAPHARTAAGPAVVLGGGENDPSPTGIASLRGELWVLGSHSVLRRIDPRTEGLAGRSIRLPRDTYGLTAGAGALWAVNPARRRIVRIDPGSGKLTSARVAGVQLRTLAVTDTDVWVATGMSRTGSRLTRFDPRTLRRTGATRISFPTFALAASGSRVWAMDTLHGAVAGFDREGPA